MKLFESESAAREYLQKRIPPEEKEKEVDLAPLKERLFEIPEKLSPGHYDFEGQHGLKVTFDLVAADMEFGRCYNIYKGLYDQDGNGDVTGKYRPIYSIINLNIQTDNFSYKDNGDPRYTDITWLPNLKSVNSELSHSFSYIDRAQIYLIEEDGFFSRPIDLLGFFHELGHIKTRLPSDLTAEHASIKTTYSTVTGLETEPLKGAALELQRERDANAWMLKNTKNLFKDLKIPRELVSDFVHHSQMKSYHEANRRRLEKSTPAPIDK